MVHSLVWTELDINERKAMEKRMEINNGKVRKQNEERISQKQTMDISLYYDYQIFQAHLLVLLICFLLDPENGGDIFLRNICSYKSHTAYHHRRRHFS
jgi:hypothetical protein